MNSQKFPAAAHAWLVQEKPPGHCGSKKYGIPLAYPGRPICSETDLYVGLPAMVGSGLVDDPAGADEQPTPLPRPPSPERNYTRIL